MVVSKDLRQQVASRAMSRCEYCLMHQSLQGATFHVEHVVPISKGGSDELPNLSLACPSCNLHKSDRTQVVDPIDGSEVQLFNPRMHNWTEHFSWDKYAINGLTAIGRATLSALDFNHVRRLQIRQAEERLGLFPPKSS